MVNYIRRGTGYRYEQFVEKRGQSKLTRVNNI